MKKDPDFRITRSFFGVTATSNSKPPVIRPIEVGTPKGRRKVDLPDRMDKSTKKKFRQSLQILR